jgi:hypothetical protein
MSGRATAMQALEQYLQENGWAAQRMAGQTAFEAHKALELCPVTYYFQLKEELEQFLWAAPLQQGRRGARTDAMVRSVHSTQAPRFGQAPWNGSDARSV